MALYSCHSSKSVDLIVPCRKPPYVVFLLRFAERRFFGLLFQEPPRKTRSGEGQAPAPGRTTRSRNGAADTTRCLGTKISNFL